LIVIILYRSYLTKMVKISIVQGLSGEPLDTIEINENKCIYELKLMIKEILDKKQQKSIYIRKILLMYNNIFPEYDATLKELKIDNGSVVTLIISEEHVDKFERIEELYMRIDIILKGDVELIDNMTLENEKTTIEILKDSSMKSLKRDIESRLGIKIYKSIYAYANTFRFDEYPDEEHDVDDDFIIDRYHVFVLYYNKYTNDL